MRSHFCQILILEVSQGHVLDQVLGGHSLRTDLTSAPLPVEMIEEHEPLVQERLEVDVLPLQGLDAGVVGVAAVEDQVLSRVAEVAAIGEGTLVST